MLDGSLKALLMLNVEPQLDIDDAPATLKALGSADMVVAFTAFKSAALDSADVLLPITPFTETSGSFVNAEGRLQGFRSVVKALGDSRPAWKALRVLGNMLELEGFDFETSEDVRKEALGGAESFADRLDNRSTLEIAKIPLPTLDGAAIERIADLPIYATDVLVRRAESLQLTADARPALASLSPALADELGLAEGSLARFSNGVGQSVELPVSIDSTLAPRCVRIPVGLPFTAALGAAFGALSVKKL